MKRRSGISLSGKARDLLENNMLNESKLNKKDKQKLHLHDPLAFIILFSWFWLKTLPSDFICWSNLRDIYCVLDLNIMSHNVLICKTIQQKIRYFGRDHTASLFQSWYFYIIKINKLFLNMRHYRIFIHEVKVLFLLLPNKKFNLLFNNHKIFYVFSWA